MGSDQCITPHGRIWTPHKHRGEAAHRAQVTDSCPKCCSAAGCSTGQLQACDAHHSTESVAAQEFTARIWARGLLPVDRVSRAIRTIGEPEGSGRRERRSSSTSSSASGDSALARRSASTSHSTCKELGCQQRSRIRNRPTKQEKKQGTHGKHSPGRVDQLDAVVTIRVVRRLGN